MKQRFDGLPIRPITSAKRVASSTVSSRAPRRCCAADRRFASPAVVARPFGNYGVTAVDDVIAVVHRRGHADVVGENADMGADRQLAEREFRRRADQPMLL